MKIKKFFIINDEKTRLVSAIFDKMIQNFDFPWNFDEMEFHIRDENKAVVSDNKCLIVINYNDFFVQHVDKRGISVLILRLFFKCIFRLSTERMPEIIEDIIVNRKMIRKGYGDDILFYYYEKNLGATAKTSLEELALSVAWLSFYGLDSYNSDLFARKTRKFPEINNLIECLKQDLDGENLKIALKIYSEVAKCR